METLIVTGKRTNKLDAQGQLTDEVLVDKNGKKYCVLEFSTPDTVYTRNAKGQMTAIKRPVVSVGGYSAWEISNLPSLKGKPDFGWELEIGEEVQGTIAKRQVEPYKVGERMVSTASVITFANSESAKELELDIAVQFNRKGHKLVDQTQEQADYLNKMGISDATAGTAEADKALAQTNASK